MQKINFIKTSIPEGQYKQKYSLGNIIVYHIGTTFNSEQNTYECYECTLPKATFDETKVRAAFAQFSAKLDALKLEETKADKIAEITDYDTSSSVNGFYLNDTLIPWSSDDGSTLNKDVRMGLRQNIKDKQKLGEVNIDMWLDGMKITLPCEKADAFMCNLENYAYECFNVTAAHKKAVEDMESVEEVEAFDVTADYPQQLVMKL